MSLLLSRIAALLISTLVAACQTPRLISADELAHAVPLRVRIVPAEQDFSIDYLPRPSGAPLVAMRGSVGIAASTAGAFAEGAIAARRRQESIRKMAPLKQALGSAKNWQAVESSFRERLSDVPAFAKAPQHAAIASETTLPSAQGGYVARITFARRLSADGGAAIFSGTLEIARDLSAAELPPALHWKQYEQQISMTQVKELAQQRDLSNPPLEPEADPVPGLWLAEGGRLFLLAQQLGIRGIAARMATDLPSGP